MNQEAELKILREQLDALRLQVEGKRNPVATSSGGLPESKHLNGQNYAEWKFQMKNFLIDAGLWGCIDSPAGTTVDKELDLRALAKINLSIKPIAAAETKKASTAKEAWNSLRNLYEDKGIVRRIGLYSSLFKTKFEDFSSMSAYIDHIVSIAEQLDNIGKPLDDEAVGGIILGGLPENFRPLILGIQGSNQITTVEFVKNILLQENVKDLSSSSRLHDNTFYAKSHRPKHFQKPKCSDKVPVVKNAKKPRCFNCNELGHLSYECQKPNRRNKDKTEKRDKHLTFFSSADFENKTLPNCWYLDSGCNAHMTPRNDWMNDFHPNSNQQIDVANGNSVSAEGTGAVKIALSSGKSAVAKKVIHVPGITSNLLSVSQIVQKGYSIIFDSKGGRVVNCPFNVQKHYVIGTATEEKGLYKLDNDRPIASVAVIDSHDIWHRRLGHLNQKDMHLLAQISTGMKLKNITNVVCVPCVKGKQSRKPFPKFSERKSEEILELVHSDLCGPMQTPSVGGSKYFLTFIDDFSRKSFVYFLKTKDEVKEKFLEFKAFVENQTGKRIKSLRSDNGGEYINKSFESFLKSSGIKHQLTVPRSPQQNGVAERLNRTLVEKARTMLTDADLSTDLWAEAVNTANYLRNLSPTKPLQKKTPEEAWSNSKPDLSHLRIFGCKVLVHVPDELRKKWDPKSTERIFVGYSENSKGYRVIHPVTKKLFISLDVIFLENEFLNRRESFTDCSTESEHEIANDESSLPEADPPCEDVIIEESRNDSNERSMTNEPSDDLESVQGFSDDCNSRRIPIPNKRYFNDDFIVYQTSFMHSDPVTYKEAMQLPDAEKWKTAINDEVKAHQKNNSWEICDLPPGKTAIKSRWVFQRKYKANGEIEKYKVRLVAKGCSQKYGIDYEETFSPTLRQNSIRFLISLAAKYDLKLFQMDVVTAFLHPELKEEIYMELPSDTGHFTNRYCRLKKTVYGLKQASRIWYQKLSESLNSMGLRRSQVDPCIFIKREGKIFLIVAVYVDDLLVLSNNDKEKNTLFENLKKQFNMKDLGEAHYIIGYHIERDHDKKEITLDQHKYIKDTLKRFGLEESKPASTPLAIDNCLSNDMSPKDEDEIKYMKTVPYREAVGALLYISQGTRPDISHAVGVVSRFCNNPGKAHWTAVKRILRYLKGTISKKLHFYKDGGNLHAFSDSDWGNNKDDRRSVTGYVFLNAGGSISWNSKRQPTVALSTTEAEYMALSAATQELIWLRQLRDEIESVDSDPISVFCDNQGAIFISKNPATSRRVKHVDIRHHFIREKIEEGLMAVNYIESDANLADCLTKAITSDRLSQHVGMMGLA